MRCAESSRWSKARSGVLTIALMAAGLMMFFLSARAHAGSYTVTALPGFHEGSTCAPKSINKAGQIIGYGTFEDEKRQGYLLTPIPEPISMIFFGTGLVGVVTYVSRRRMRK